MTNPFNNAGRPAHGERFVGRQDLARRLAGVATTGRPANMAVIGNHRVGKTSLIHHCLNDQAFDRNDLVIANVSVGTHRTADDVLRMICREAQLAMERRQIGNVRFTAELLRQVESQADWYGLLNKFMAFFNAIQQGGAYVLIILDEFDRIRMNGVQVAHFQLLRDVCTEEWSSAGLITVSRQRVKSLEIGATGGSCLDQVLAVRTFVGLFSDAECRELLTRGGGVGVDLLPFMSEIERLTGRHPYLLELLCYEIVERATEASEIDVPIAYGAVRQHFSDFFGRLVKIIDADLGDGASKLFQVVTGVGLDVSVDDTLALLQYGLIVAPEDGPVRPFSEEFDVYLRSVADGRDFRSVWLDCEVGLRRLIRSVLLGGDSVGSVAKLLPSSFSDQVRAAQGRLSKRPNEEHLSLDELDYMYPIDLFQIITTMWDRFGPVLGESKQVWQRRGEAISGARNEVMHVRPIPTNKRLPAQAAAAEVVAALQRSGHLEPVLR